MTQQHFQFLMDALQRVSQSESLDDLDAFLLSNLDKLDYQLGTVLENWATKIFDDPSEPDREAIATDLVNFSNILQEFRLNTQQCIDIAIVAYRSALTFYNQQNYPYQWATIKNNLASAYFKSLSGERSTNIELAITSYHQALNYRTRDEYPVDYGVTQNNLGNAYQERIEGDRGENIELAIEAYQRSLEIRQKEQYPLDYAITQNNLGTAYFSRIEGLRQDNIELSINSYQEALAEYKSSNLKLQQSITYNNLGNAYSERLTGAQGDNLDQAIENYRLALTIYNQAEYPLDWAVVNSNLGNTYFNRIHGSKKDNIDQAIDYYQKSLQIYTKETFPLQWANIQNNLGNAYQQKISGEPSDNIESAINCYHETLNFYNQEEHPFPWATTQNNLGNAYRRRIKGDKEQNLNLAVGCYRQALREYEQDKLPLAWANLHYNVAQAYKDQKNYDESFGAYYESLKVYTPQYTPHKCYEVALEMGNLAYALNFPEHFTAAYHLVLQAMVEMRNYEDYETIYQRLLTTGIEQEAWEEVLSTLENYRYWHYRPQIIADLTKTPTAYAQTKEQLNTTRRLWQSTQQVRHREQIDTLLTERGQKWERFYHQSPLQALTEVQKLITYKDIQEIVASPEVGLMSIYYHHHQNCLLLFLLVNHQLTNHRIDLGGSLDDFLNLTAPELTQQLQLNELCAEYLSTVSQLVLVADQNLRQIPWANLPVTETDDLDRSVAPTNKALAGVRNVTNPQSMSFDETPEEEILPDRDQLDQLEIEQDATDTALEPVTIEPAPITIEAETVIVANNADADNLEEENHSEEAQDVGNQLETSEEETAIEEDTVLVEDNGIKNDYPSSSTHEEVDAQVDGVVEVEVAPSPIPEPGVEEVEEEVSEVEEEENEDQVEIAVEAALQQQLQSTAESEAPVPHQSTPDLPSEIEQWVLNFDDFVAPVSPRATIPNQASTNTTNDNDVWVLTLPETNRAPVVTTAVMERWDLTWEDVETDTDEISTEMEDIALDNHLGQALELLPPELDVPSPQTSPEETSSIVDELANGDLLTKDDPEPEIMANKEGPQSEELEDSATSLVNLEENSDSASDSLSLEPGEQMIASITEAEETAIELSGIAIDSPVEEPPILVSEEKNQIETFTITDAPDPILNIESAIAMQDQSPAKPMEITTTLGQKYFLKVVDNILLLKCYEDMGG